MVKPAQLAGHQCAVVGVFWPSANFDFLIGAQGSTSSGNAAAVGDDSSDPESQQKVIARLEALKAPGVFDEPAEQATLSRAQALVPTLDGNPPAQAEYIECLRSLPDRSAVNDEDGSDIFFRIKPGLVFDRLCIQPDAIDDRIPRTGNALALSPPAASTPAAGHATGLLDIFPGATASATNAVSYLTYYLMKARAGTVGSNGVASMLDQLAAAPALARVHLIGHSFGGRLVTAAAMASKTTKLHSMSLLQAAYSHNGFSPENMMNGFFRAVVETGRVEHAIIATHTKHDTAVGIAYPLASRLANVTSSSLGDENESGCRGGRHAPARG